MAPSPWMAADNEVRMRLTEPILNDPRVWAAWISAAESPSGSEQAPLVAAIGIVVKNLDNRRFIAGFGTNGGEEFLSYMNIGEALAVRGGADWDGIWELTEK